MKRFTLNGGPQAKQQICQWESALSRAYQRKLTPKGKYKVLHSMQSARHLRPQNREVVKAALRSKVCHNCIQRSYARTLCRLGLIQCTGSTSPRILV